jgi:hypothetical protein
MKDLIRTLAAVALAGLMGACGGTGGGAAENPPGGGASPPAVTVAGGWDTWNWDEGAFTE